MSTAAPSANARAQVAQRAKNQQNGDGQPPNAVQLVNQMQTSGEFARALPANIITPERFTRVALTALRKNDDLLRCDPTSVVGALVVAAQLGLEVNTPLEQAYLIPYKGECTLQIGYRGYISIARRSGMVDSITARTVYARDEFSVAYGLDDQLVHKPTMFGDRGEPIAYYAVAKYQGGGYNFLVMSRPDVENHRQRFSKQPNGFGWRNNFDAMAQKTCIRMLAKFMPMSVEFAQAMVADDRTHKPDADLDSLTIDAEPVDPPADHTTGEIMSGAPVEEPPEPPGWEQ